MRRCRGYAAWRFGLSTEVDLPAVDIEALGSVAEVNLVASRLEAEACEARHAAVSSLPVAQPAGLAAFSDAGRALRYPSLLQWTVSALVASYTYDYHDQAGQVAAARSRFSRAGQDGAHGPFGPSMDHEAAVRNRWLCRAQADQAATVLEKGVVLDVLGYDVEVPVVQTCDYSTGDFTNRFRVRARVVRTGELDHPEGVMIDRVQVTRR